MKLASLSSLALLALLLVGCTSPILSGARDTAPDTYLKWVSFEMLGNENVVLRWPTRKMPLRVYLPPAPGGLFEDPAAIEAAVREGVLGWADVVEPGVPSFTFVDSLGAADIPIVWAEEPDGDWYVAHCAYDIGQRTRRFGVSRILVTGRWADGHVADGAQVQQVVLHEMGHALGLGGHSPDPEDIMYPSVSPRETSGLSERDRATLQALYALPIGKRISGARGR
ncbi:MAG: matrixin family metalloprotease [Myxococcota bacterium]|nr:matrixin family metalloprotease [Myxococcota bacterium]